MEEVLHSNIGHCFLDYKVDVINILISFICNIHFNINLSKHQDKICLWMMMMSETVMLHSEVLCA